MPIKLLAKVWVNLLLGFLKLIIYSQDPNSWCFISMSNLINPCQSSSLQCILLITFKGDRLLSALFQSNMKPFQHSMRQGFNKLISNIVFIIGPNIMHTYIKDPSHPLLKNPMDDILTETLIIVSNLMSNIKGFFSLKHHSAKLAIC